MSMWATKIGLHVLKEANKKKKDMNLEGMNARHGRSYGYNRV